MAEGNLFTIFDYIILSITLLTPVAIGSYFGVVNKKTTEELLVGGRKLKIFPTAASIMATTVNAVTLLGYPAEVYSYGIQIFQMTLVSIFCTPLSVYLFVPYFYHLKLTSINEYLEMRFNSPIVRQFAALIFILQQVVLTSIVLYAPSIVLESFFYLSPWISVAGLGLVGALYTSVGGLKAVVWIDTFQLLLMYTGLIAILVRATMVAGGILKIFQVAADGGRLKLFDFSVDPFMRHNFVNFVVGFSLVRIFQPGIGVQQVQRYSSLPTLEAAKQSVLLSLPIKIVALGFCLFTGLALYAVYVGCDPVIAGEAKRTDELIPRFLIKELVFIPGMLGFFTSCLFSSVLSSYSSSINGLVAVTWEDFLSKLPIYERMEESRRARVSMLVGLFFGVLTVFLAFFAKHMGGILQATNTIIGFPIGILGAVFILALFVPFANAQGVTGGMIVGLASTLFINLQAVGRKIVNPTLELTINNCPNHTTDFVGSNANLHSAELEWPEKMYTLSYLLYTTFGTVVTFSSGVVLSLIFRVFSKNPIAVVDSRYLHPLLQKKIHNKQVDINQKSADYMNGQAWHL